MSKLTAIVIASALALGATGFANAQDNNLQNGNPPPPAEQGAPGPHHMMKGEDHMMFKGLNLTAEQKQKIRDIMHSARKESPRPPKGERQELHSIVAADHFDRAKAEQAIDKLAAANKERMLQRLEVQNKLYNVLTPEQKRQFNEKFEKHLNDPAPPAPPAPKAPQ